MKPNNGSHLYPRMYIKIMRVGIVVVWVSSGQGTGLPCPVEGAIISPAKNPSFMSL